MSTQFFLDQYFPEQYLFNDGAKAAFCQTPACQDAGPKLFIVDSPDAMTSNPDPYVIGTAEFRNVYGDWNKFKYQAILGPEKTLVARKDSDLAQLNTMLTALTTITSSDAELATPEDALFPK